MYKRAGGCIACFISRRKRRKPTKSWHYVNLNIVFLQRGFRRMRFWIIRNVVYALYMNELQHSQANSPQCRNLKLSCVLSKTYDISSAELYVRQQLNQKSIYWNNNAKVYTIQAFSSSNLCYAFEVETSNFFVLIL